MFLYKPIVLVCVSGRDTHISGCAGIVARDPFESYMFGVLKSFQTSPWGRSSHRFHCQHLIAPTCSQPSVYIFADCAENWLNKTVQISSNPSLILSNFSYFSPIHNNSTDSPSRAGSLTRCSPICRCPRRNVSNDRHRNRRNHLRCRRYRRLSWVGGWGRNHGQNGGGNENHERRWGYRADFILSFLVWNYLPWPLGFRREGCDIYGARLETNFWHIHRKIIFQGGCLLGHWLQSSNCGVWLHACLRSMKTSCHVQQGPHVSTLDKINEALAWSPGKRSAKKL